jgi:beta-ureidopropionase
MKIALFQPVVDLEMSINFDKAITAIQQAAQKDAKLICFPEIQFSPFFPQFAGMDASKYLFTHAHTCIRELQEVCRKNRIAAVPNLYLEENGRYYDASPMIDADGTLLGVSKMVHIVQAACYYEQDYYAPSDDGFHVYNTRAGKIGIVICFDRHFPESIRTCALQGAQLIVVPTANMKGEPMDLFEWEMRVQAMHNGVYIAMCNRVGREGEMDFAGESLVVDPFGTVVLKANDQEQLLIADVDFEQVAAARKQRPYLALRRPGMYLWSEEL